MERSAQNIKRLLELFPVTSLRSQWSNVTGTKEEICFEIAEKYGWQGAVDFVNANLSCCKQHVYIFSHSGRIDDLPVIELPDTELVADSGVQNGERRQLYIINFEYKVVLRDPFEDMSLTFLWPLRLDFTAQHLVARFVILEKNISSYVLDGLIGWSLRHMVTYLFPSDKQSLFKRITRRYLTGDKTGKDQ